MILSSKLSVVHCVLALHLIWKPIPAHYDFIIILTIVLTIVLGVLWIGNVVTYDFLITLRFDYND